MIVDDELKMLGVKLSNSKTGNGKMASLYHGKYSQELIPILRKISDLEELVFYVTKIEDHDLEDISVLTDLKSLAFISCNKISDQGILNLSNMISLKKLSVLDTKVTVDGAKKLTSILPRLTVYNVAESQGLNRIINVSGNKVI